MLVYPYTEGQTVTYHGSHAEMHGRTYRAWTCRCRRAHAVEQPRFLLVAPDPTGPLPGTSGPRRSPPPRKENPMSFPKIVRQTPVVHGDEMALTVSTVQIARNYYDTVVFDDNADCRHVGWLIGDYVINKSSKRAATREAAMDDHREALYAARTEFPKAPQS